MESPDAQLRALLIELFKPWQFRNFLGSWERYAGVSSALPSTDTAPARYFAAAVRELRRAGRLDEQLFEHLGKERPGRLSGIERIAEIVRDAPTGVPTTTTSSTPRPQAVATTPRPSHGGTSLPRAATSSIGLLHLTDLHAGQSGQRTLWGNWEEALFDDLTTLHERCGPWDVVLFTGDLTQTGTAEEFEHLEKDRLRPLWDKLRALGSDPVLVAVPGNHDLVRPPEGEPSAVLLGEWSDKPRVRRRFRQQPDSWYRQVVERAFAPFSAWRWPDPDGLERPYRLPEAETRGMLPGDFAATLDVRGLKLGVLGLNSAFLQLLGGDYQGRLALLPEQITAACGERPYRWAEGHDFCLLLTHHPPDWLGAEARSSLKSDIAPGRFDAHLFGHMHEAHTLVQSVGGGAQQRQVQGNSLFGLEHWMDPQGREEDRAFGYSAMRLTREREQRTLQVWPRLGMKQADGRLRLVAHPRLNVGPGGAMPAMGLKAKAASVTRRRVTVSGPSALGEEAGGEPPFRAGASAEAEGVTQNGITPSTDDTPPPLPALERVSPKVAMDALLCLFPTDSLRRFIRYHGGIAMKERVEGFEGRKEKLVGFIVDGFVELRTVDEGLFRELARWHEPHGPWIRELQTRWLAVYPPMVKENPTSDDEPAPQPPRPASPEPDAPATPSPRAKRRAKLSHFVLTLDRRLQWLSLKEACIDPTHNAVFLVHGTPNQGLHAFTQRIHKQLSKELGRLQVVRNVRHRGDNLILPTPDDWGEQLRRGLGMEALPLVDALEQAGNMAPHLLIFGTNTPLRVESPDWPDGLNAREQTALCEFLSKTLPHALGRNVKHPLQFLIPVEVEPYEGPSPGCPFFDQLEQTLEGLAGPNLRYEALSGLSLPPWGEIRQDLKRRARERGRVLTPDQLATVHRAHQRILASPDPHFLDLAEALDDALPDWFKQA